MDARAAAPTTAHDGWRDPALDLLGLLDPDELAMAAAVVLADGHLTPGELAIAVASSPTAGAAAIDVLKRTGLVRPVPEGSITVAHAFLRGALLDLVDPVVRRRLHAALTPALETTGAPAALVAAHAEASADPRLAAGGIRAAAAACRDALRVGELDAAVTLLGRIERLAATLPAA
jgi:hypothetical protein